MGVVLVTPVVLVAALLMWAGVALLLSHSRWIQRTGLTARLAPYCSPGRTRRGDGVLSAGSFKEVIGPLSSLVGERLAGLLRVGEELAIRLDRVGSPVGVTGFRVRQVGWATAAAGAAVAVSAGMRLGVLLSAGMVLGAPLLAFLVLEQRVATASAKWQQTLRLELPVVAEQVGMLLGAGWGLGGALARISRRGAGACATDLKRVVARIGQGITEIEALREWAVRADVAALHRLVSVLAFNREAADLGRLISEEARAMRRDAQRDLIEIIEKRTQQVWIPVTAATLVPGVMLIGVPFVEALSVFGA